MPLQLDLSLKINLFAYIGGEGGTGKSQVINAIQFLFETCSVEHWLQFSLLHRYSILQHTVIIPPERATQRQTLKSQLAVSFAKIDALRITIGSVKFLTVDEVSIFSTQWFAKLDARCKQARCPVNYTIVLR